MMYRLHCEGMVREHTDIKVIKRAKISIDRDIQDMSSWHLLKTRGVDSGKELQRKRRGGTKWVGPNTEWRKAER